MVTNTITITNPNCCLRNKCNSWIICVNANKHIWTDCCYQKLRRIPLGRRLCRDTEAHGVSGAINISRLLLHDSCLIKDNRTQLINMLLCLWERSDRLVWQLTMGGRSRLCLLVVEEVADAARLNQMTYCPSQMYAQSWKETKVTTTEVETNGH